MRQTNGYLEVKQERLFRKWHRKFSKMMISEQEWKAPGKLEPLSTKELRICLLIFGVPWCIKQERICLQCKRPRFHPWVRKIPWRREQQPIPVFLPGESHGQRSLAGYSPWVHKESDTTKQLTHSSCIQSNNSFAFPRITGIDGVREPIHFQTHRVDNMAYMIWNQSRIRCCLFCTELALVSSGMRPSFLSLRTFLKIISDQWLLTMSAAMWQGMHVSLKTEYVETYSCLLIQHPLIHSIRMQRMSITNLEPCSFTKSGEVEASWHVIPIEEKLNWESGGLVWTSVLLLCSHMA